MPLTTPVRPPAGLSIPRVDPHYTNALEGILLPFHFVAV